MALFTASFTLASCDLLGDKDDVACAGDDCADKKDDDKDDDKPDDEEEEEEEEDSGSMPPDDSGAPPPPVPEDCEVLCACVADMGGNASGCGVQCGNDLNDDDPNDRAQCVDGLTEAGFADCVPDCDAFPDGS